MIVPVCFRMWLVMESGRVELEGDWRIAYGQEMICKIYNGVFIQVRAEIGPNSLPWSW